MNARLPGEGAISVVTIGELALGVVVATDEASRFRRIETLALAESSFTPLSIDARVARTWARLTHHTRRRAPVNDCWIAATALVHGRVVLTQDRDYEAFGVEVLRI